MNIELSKIVLIYIKIDISSIFWRKSKIKNVQCLPQQISFLLWRDYQQTNKELFFIKTKLDIFYYLFAMSGQMYPEALVQG